MGRLSGPNDSSNLVMALGRSTSVESSAMARSARSSVLGIVAISCALLAYTVITNYFILNLSEVCFQLSYMWAGIDDRQPRRFRIRGYSRGSFDATTKPFQRSWSKWASDTLHILPSIARLGSLESMQVLLLLLFAIVNFVFLLNLTLISLKL